MKTRAEQLEALAQKIRSIDTAPLCAFRKKNGYRMVFGEGNPNAEIMFIGEAPGRKEAETGRPFVGRAGQLLDTLLESIGLHRQGVYITNIVKDRPPKNRDPLKEEIAFYKSFLLKQIRIIQPRLIATLGRFSMDFMLTHFNLKERGQNIGNLHGRPLLCDVDRNLILFPLYHPAAVFYNRSLETPLKEDFAALSTLVANGRNF